MTAARHARLAVGFATAFVAALIILGGCASGASADRPAAASPELVIPPMPPASPAPARAAPSPSSSSEPAAETPAGMSYEEALAQLTTDAAAAHGKALTNAELAAPLRDGSFVQACGAPESLKVTVRVVVRRGRAAGVSIRTTPHDDAVVRCVDAHVRGLRWSSSPFVDSLTITY